MTERPRVFAHNFLEPAPVVNIVDGYEETIDALVELYGTDVVRANNTGGGNNPGDTDPVFGSGETVDEILGTIDDVLESGDAPDFITGQITKSNYTTFPGRGQLVFDSDEDLDNIR